MPLHKYTPGCPCCICSLGLTAAQLAASAAIAWEAAADPVWGVDGDGLLELTNAGSGAAGSASRLISVGTNTQLHFAITWDSLVGDDISGVGIAGFLGFQRNRTGSDDKYELVTLDENLEPVTVLDSFNAGERNSDLGLSALKSIHVIATKVSDTECEVLFYYGFSGAITTQSSYLPSVTVDWPGNARFGAYANVQTTKIFSVSLTCSTAAAPNLSCYQVCDTEWIPTFYYIRAGDALACLLDPFAGGLFDDIAPFLTDVAMFLTTSSESGSCVWEKTIIQPGGFQRVWYRLFVGDSGDPPGSARLVVTLNGDGSPGSHYTDFRYLCEGFDCVAESNVFTFVYSHPNTEDCFELDPPPDITIYRDPA